MNPFLKLIELKQQEAQLKNDLPIAKQEAIEYYKAHPVLTGEKTTGQFSAVDGVKLPAKLTWKLVSSKVKNPIYKEKHERLAEVEESLGILNANKLDEIKSKIDDLNGQWRLLLINPETEELKAELRSISPTLDGEPIEELSVTLPKF